MRVLHILNGLGFGGAETWLLEIMKQNQGKVQFDFLLTGGVERELDSFFKDQGCNLYYVRYSSKGIFGFIKGLNKVIKEGRYDAVHNHEDFSAGFHWLFLLFRLPRVRISHAHNSMIYINNYTNTFGRKCFYKIGKFLNGLLATKLTGTSLKLMTELGYDTPYYARKRIECLYCGSEPSRFQFDPLVRKEYRSQLGFSESDKVVIFIGRIGLNRDNEVNHKNPEFAFEISQKLTQRDPSFRFLFVGEKDRLGNAMEKQVEEMGLKDNIIFLGKRKDVHHLLKAADLLLFTSTLEPFGLVLVEAQFCSLPLVASNILTNEAVVFPELFRLLDVSKKDTEEWVGAIEQLMNKTYDRNEFAKKHQYDIENSPFSINNSYLRLIKHYSTPSFKGIKFN